MDNPGQQEPPEVPRITVADASNLFAEAGTPRSPRTIIRYCARGHLDCIKVDTEQNEKYLISRESIDRRIEEIRQVARSSRVSPGRDVSRPDSTRLDSESPPEPGSDEAPKLKQKIKSLESELIDQKIANQYKSRFIEQLKSERSAFFKDLQIQSRHIGQLETRLEILGSHAADRLVEPAPSPGDPNSNLRAPADAEPAPKVAKDSRPSAAHDS